jgi:hypothetical protein
MEPTSVCSPEAAKYSGKKTICTMSAVPRVQGQGMGMVVRKDDWQDVRTRGFLGHTGRDRGWS